jgi:uncharacterized membrane protein
MKNQEKSMNATVPQNRREWLIPAGLLILSAVPVIAGAVRLTELSGDAEVTAANARFFASPLPVVLHIISVTLYSLMGAFQFAPSFRRRHRRWHRMTGRILIPSGLVAALSGLWMSHFYPWPVGDGILLYGFRLFFGTAMLLSLLFGIRALWRRDYANHGDWMVRAYAIGLGAGTQVLTHLPWVLYFGAPNELTRALLMGAGWVINLAVAEWIIRRQPPQPTKRSRPAMQWSHKGA